MSLLENPEALLPWLEWPWPGIGSLSTTGLPIFMVQPETASASATTPALAMILAKPSKRNVSPSFLVLLKV
jgi:hypothetical protein